MKTRKQRTLNKIDVTISSSSDEHVAPPKAENSLINKYSKRYLRHKGKQYDADIDTATSSSDIDRCLRSKNTLKAKNLPETGSSSTESKSVKTPESIYNFDESENEFSMLYLSPDRSKNKKKKAQSKKKETSDKKNELKPVFKTFNHKLQRVKKEKFDSDVTMKSRPVRNSSKPIIAPQNDKVSNLRKRKFNSSVTFSPIPISEISDIMRAPSFDSGISFMSPSPPEKIHRKETSTPAVENRIKKEDIGDCFGFEDLLSPEPTVSPVMNDFESYEMEIENLASPSLKSSKDYNRKVSDDSCMSITPFSEIEYEKDTDKKVKDKSFSDAVIDHLQSASKKPRKKRSVGKKKIEAMTIEMNNDFSEFDSYELSIEG